MAQDSKVELTSDADLQVAVRRALRHAGVTLEELGEQARQSRFSSERARLAWFMISPLIDGRR